ncbi:MAG: hypothetical protein JXA78_12625 [Anaerolineales bacterium]|nr:hypothetical protein [Anaerolineales bacterium]
MIQYRKLFVFIALAVLVGVACSLFSPDIQPQKSPTPAAPPTPLPPRPVQPGEANPDEPVFIMGDIPYTSPFFLNTLYQPFVMLEDQSGFAQRDEEFEFALPSQVLGPVEIHSDDSLGYYLSLPSIPQGAQLDVDNDSEQDAGVQVFAVAYWSNTWGDTFLEERDGTGWSTAYASTITDPENDNEIIGGVLVVWSPNDEQGFPTGFGEDGLLFTEDDPIAPLPAGYNIVDLDQEPFRIYKEARPQINLNEGVIAVNDYSEMDYQQAFQSLFKKASREYPFTTEKGIDWQALQNEFSPKLEAVKDSQDFYKTLKEFTYRIPDGHVNLSFDQDYFYDNYSGGLGLVTTLLSDSRLIVTKAFEGAPGARAGVEEGAEILSWNGAPVDEALDQVTPFFGPYSTDHARRLGQVDFLTRMPPGTRVDLEFQNPGEQAQQATLESVVEYDSLYEIIPGFNQDELALPMEAYVLDESGLGYLRIYTFSDDYQLMARLWDYYIQGLIDEQVPGLIIDLRVNSGGSLGIAMDFAGYFFDEEILLYEGKYYNENSGEFEATKHPTRVEPAPLYYEGPVAVLVGTNCISACEGLAYVLQQAGRSIIIGHYPTAGAFGEVGRGQYTLPSDISMQFPTGRPETTDGKVVIEGVGVLPDITVPVTEDSALGRIDALLEAAIEALLNEL